MPNNRNIVLSIQYLRGAAALAVVLFHVAGHAGFSAAVGASGVDVFFIISGFVMWTVTSRRPVTPGRFMIDRLSRIAPIYVLLTIAIYLLATHVPGLFPNMQANLSHAILSALFIPHTDPHGTAFPLVVPGWTLNYEMFFYLVFAAGLGLREHTRIWMYTGLLSALTLVGLLFRSDYAAVNAYTNPQLLEFVVGMWFGVAWNANKMPRVTWGWAALLAGVMALVAWQLVRGTESTDGGRILVWGVPAALVVGGLLTIERRSKIVQSEFALMLGNASFSIYLIHVFIAAATWRLVGHLSVPIFVIAAMINSVIGGLVFWHLVEQPVTRLVRHWFHRPTSMVRAV